jgi:Protein of unknown function (DUF3987)
MPSLQTWNEVAMSAGRKWPAPLRCEAMYGLAGRIVLALRSDTEADDAALLFQLLAAFGNAAGRNAYFTVEATYHFGNLFVVLVGATGVGRKGTSWGRIRGLFDKAAPDWRATCVKSGLSSGEGLIYHVRDPQTKIVEKDGKPVETLLDAGIPDKRLLVIETELASTLRRMERDGNSLSPVLRQAWDAEEYLSTLVKNEPLRATNAHVSMIGHITQDELARRLAETEKANGFGNRFLWALVRRSRILPEGGGDRDLSDIVSDLRRALAFTQQERELRFAAEARVLWSTVYESLTAGEPGLTGAMTARAAPLVRRLALLYALLDESAVISAEHLRAGLAVWLYAEDSARCLFGNATGDTDADVILKALRARQPDGMTRREIRDLFQRNRSGPSLTLSLNLLASEGLALLNHEETGGRPAERWRATTKTTETSKAWTTFAFQPTEATPGPPFGASDVSVVPMSNTVASPIHASERVGEAGVPAATPDAQRLVRTLASDGVSITEIATFTRLPTSNICAILRATGAGASRGSNC